MRKNVGLISSLILLVIFIGWVGFLVLNESNDKVSEEVKDAISNQLNDAKEKVEKSGTKTAEKPTPSLAPSPIDEPTPTPDSGETTPTPTPLVAPDHTKFDYIVANVSDKMNVREGAGQDKKVVGSLPANGYGKIIERGSDWFKIKSGNVTGYVSTQYILTDDAAIKKIRELGALKIKVVGNDVNVRKEPNTTCEVRLQAKTGALYEYYPEYSTQLFYAVMIDNEISYISTSYAEVAISLKTASK
ncbi:MAG: SH3 domain-containing protein [Lachnospiraceae bacterium]|nr:SH3 domain-containing protein [Lachnospiraceae bacterium]